MLSEIYGGPHTTRSIAAHNGNGPWHDKACKWAPRDKPCLMLKYWQELRGPQSSVPFIRLLVMPLDDRAGTREVRRTCALFSLTINVWENAMPEMKTVYLC